MQYQGRITNKGSLTNTTKRATYEVPGTIFTLPTKADKTHSAIQYIDTVHGNGNIVQVGFTVYNQRDIFLVCPGQRLTTVVLEREHCETQLFLIEFRDLRDHRSQVYI